MSELRRLRIGIEATFVRGPRVTGIERYVIDLVRGLARVASERSSYLSLALFLHQGGVRHFSDILPCFDTVMVSPFATRVFTEQVWLPWAIRRSRVMLVHYTTLGIPLLKVTPFTTTVHDLAAWHFPWTMSRGMRYYYRHLISAALRSRKLRKAIAVSMATKDDLARLFGLDASRVAVIHRRLSPHFASIAARPDDQTAISRVLRRYGTSRRYILAVGTLEPRKNLLRLISAFGLLKAKYGVDGYDLVIVGRRGWGRAHASAPDQVEAVHMVGTVPDEDLVSLYRGATAFVLPSLYEGFGLPLLEAMVCGTPVVASNTSSIPEVAGQAAVYFDPTDEEEMARAIYTVLSNPGLRRRLVAAGYERVREFDHDEAEETIAELEKAAREGLRG